MSQASVNHQMAFMQIDHDMSLLYKSIWVDPIGIGRLLCRQTTFIIHPAQLQQQLLNLPDNLTSATWLLLLSQDLTHSEGDGVGIQWLKQVISCPLSDCFHGRI